MSKQQNQFWRECVLAVIFGDWAAQDGECVGVFNHTATDDQFECAANRYSRMADTMLKVAIEEGRI